MSSTISPTSSSTAATTSTTGTSTNTASSSAPSASSLITSTGIGSGLDITGIVSSLTTAYGFAQNTALANQTTLLDSQVSAYGTFESALDTLKLSLPPLETQSALAGFAATVGDPTIATATTDSDAVAGQYSLQVNNLATAATLTSAPIASGSSGVVGTGTLTIAAGSQTAAITIDSSNDTLSGIVSAINSAGNNPGVTASIINTTAGARLIITGDATGAANAVTVTPSGGNGGLSALSFTTTAPVDANFSINGYAATSASNQVSSAITGVTINLLKASAAATPTTLTISPDSTAAQTSVAAFVTALNGVLTSIQTLTAYDPSTDVAGPLNGNATLETFQNQLQQILGQVTQGGVAGAPKSLADLGITASTDGTYASDTTKLGNALTASVSGVASLLGGTKGIATQIDNLVNGYTKAGGLLATINQGLQTGLSSVATQQAALNAQLATYSATLTAEYNAMDTAVALLKQTQQYLTAEFNPSSSSSSSSTSSLGSGSLST